MSDVAAQSSASQNPGLGVRRRQVVLCVILALVTLAVYWPARQYDFINYDDPEYVSENPHVLQGLTLENVAWAFKTGQASNWHPLTWISHMLDVTVYGRGAGGPHFTNLLLHAANAVLLFLALNRLTGARWRSAMVAALFALHPLHVESVAWIAERKDVLSAFFGLLSLLCYACYVDELKIKNDKFKIYYGLALFCFALGLMSKPMLVTLPFVLLLLDYWPLGRSAKCEVRSEKAGELSTINYPPSTFRRLAWEKTPFFVLSAISCVVTFQAQKMGGTVQALVPTVFGERLANALVTYARYLAKMFWPADLAVPYPFQAGWPVAELALAVLVVAGVSLLVIGNRRRIPFAFTGWFWYLGMLVPVIGLVRVGTQSMADRYSYLPLIGIFIWLTWGAGMAWERYRLPAGAAGVAATLVLGVCAVGTREQLRYWANTETLFNHTLAVTADNYPAHDALGLYLFQEGRRADAVTHYREALRINPQDYQAYDNLGFAQYRGGDTAGAITNYLHALQIRPRYPNCLNNLGTALMSQHRYTNAITMYVAALRLNPDYVDAHDNLGAALFQIGDMDGAMKEARSALALMPDNSRAHNNLANVLIARGAVDEAVAHYRRALRSDPNFLEAFCNLGYVQSVRGEYDESIGCYEQALKLKPDDAQLNLDLADTLSQAGRKDEAVEYYTEALRLKPGLAAAQAGLNALAKTGRK